MKTKEEILKAAYDHHRNEVIPDNDWADWESCVQDGTTAMVYEAMQSYADEIIEGKDKELQESLLLYQNMCGQIDKDQKEIERLKEENLLLQTELNNLKYPV